MTPSKTIYRDWYGYHYFIDGKYQGYISRSGQQQKKLPPFDTWETWNKEKHTFLLSLGFKADKDLSAPEVISE